MSRMLFLLTLFSALIGKSMGSVALSKRGCTVGYGKMRVVVHIVQSPKWLIAKIKNPQVEKVHLELAAFLWTTELDIPVSIGDRYDFISVGDVYVNQPQLILQKSWQQDRAMGRARQVPSGLIEEMYPLGKIEIEVPFFIISKVEIHYVECGELKDVFNCAQNSESGSYGNNKQYYASKYDCNNKTAPIKPGGPSKSKLDYRDYDYSTTPRGTGPSTYDPETLKLFTPEDSKHHQTTAFVILFFICLMVLQNVILPIIVFTLLK